MAPPVSGAKGYVVDREVFDGAHEIRQRGRTVLHKHHFEVVVGLVGDGLESPLELFGPADGSHQNRHQWLFAQVFG